MLRRRLCYLAAAGGLLALALALRELPRLVERVAIAELARRGIPLELRVEALDHRHLRVRSLRAGSAPALEWRSAELRYRLGDLVRGRALGLEVDGLVLRGRADAAGLSFGELDPFLALSDDSAALPLVPERVELRDAGLVIEHPSGRLDLHADAALALTPHGIESLEIRGKATHATGALAGEFQLALGAGGDARGELALRALHDGLAALGVADPPAALDLAGNLEASAPQLARVFDPDAFSSGALRGSARLDVSLSGLPLGHDLGASDARARWEFEASREPDGSARMVARLPECGRIRVVPAQRDSKPIEACLRTAPEDPPSLALRAQSLELSGAIRIESFPVDWRLPELGRLSGESPVVELSARGSPKSPQLRLRTTGGRLRVSGAEVAVEGVALELDVDPVASGPMARGTLALRQLRGTGASPAFAALALAGEVEIGADRQRFGGELRGGEGALRVGLSLSQRDQPEQLALEATLHPLVLSPQASLAGLIPALAPYLSESSGTLSGELRWSQANGRSESMLRANLRGITLASPSYGRVEGLSGAFEATPVWPPETQQPVQLEILRLDPGIPLEGVTLSVHPQAGGKLEFSASAARFLGGSLELSGQGRPGAGRIELKGRGLDLGEMLRRLDVADLEGEGRVELSLPLGLEDGRLVLRGGAIRAQPGGRLRYRSANAAAALGLSGPSAALALEALRDFRYERLEAVLDGDLDTVHARLSLHGRAAEREDAPPIHLELNLHDRIAELSRALGLGRWLPDDARGD